MKKLAQLKRYAEMLSLQKQLLELQTLQKHASAPTPTPAGCTQTPNYSLASYIQFWMLQALT